MTTLNLESDVQEQAAMLDENGWTALQTEICMNVANAKFYAFAAECDRAAEYVRLGFVSQLIAADYLHVTAIYNQLYYEYGTDRIQSTVATAFASEAVAC